MKVHLKKWKHLAIDIDKGYEHELCDMIQGNLKKTIPNQTEYEQISQAAHLLEIRYQKVIPSDVQMKLDQIRINLEAGLNIFLQVSNPIDQDVSN